MHLLELITFTLYFTFILAIIFLSARKQKTDTDYVIGNRSLNFWLTALSAHASDMSSWLFMAYPAMIFTGGLFNSWVAIGLTVFMFFNWQFIAPKIRVLTEKYNAITLNSYFEKKFADHTGRLRILSAVFTCVFFLVYISAGIVSMGYLSESLLGLNYLAGISIGLFLITSYVLLGGYNTVAWLDLFQGLFLLAVIVFLPFFLIPKAGGISSLLQTLELKNVSFSLIPSFSLKTLLNVLSISLGWGLGYLGQPHIITKFMGIKDVSEMKKAKYVGLSWQILTLASATILGLIGIYFFQNGLNNPEHIILEIVTLTLPTFFSGLVLCAIFAAITNVMAAQILVTASSLAEDLYKPLINPTASHQKLLFLSRIFTVIIALVSYGIAFFKLTTINNLVLYAWSGIGASFGPLLLLSFYVKKLNRFGALAGILTGGIVSGIYPLISDYKFPIIPAFFASGTMILLVSYFTQNKGSYHGKKENTHN